MIFPFLVLVDILVEAASRDFVVGVPQKPDAAAVNVVNGDVPWLLFVHLFHTSAAGITLTWLVPQRPRRIIYKFCIHLISYHVIR